MEALRRLDPYVRSLMRIVVGFTFSLHGFQKLFGLFGGITGTGAPVHFLSIFWFAGVLETFGGLLIILGLFTRTTAFILCGEMAYAYFTAHFPRGLFLFAMVESWRFSTALPSFTLPLLVRVR